MYNPRGNDLYLSYITCFDCVYLHTILPNKFLAPLSGIESKLCLNLIWINIVSVFLHIWCVFQILSITIAWEDKTHLIQPCQSTTQKMMPTALTIPITRQTIKESLSCPIQLEWLMTGIVPYESMLSLTQLPWIQALWDQPSVSTTSNASQWCSRCFKQLGSLVELLQKIYTNIWSSFWKWPATSKFKVSLMMPSGWDCSILIERSS